MSLVNAKLLFAKEIIDCIENCNFKDKLVIVNQYWNKLTINQQNNYIIRSKNEWICDPVRNEYNNMISRSSTIELSDFPIPNYTMKELGNKETVISKTSTSLSVFDNCNYKFKLYNSKKLQSIHRVLAKNLSNQSNKLAYDNKFISDDKIKSKNVEIKNRKRKFDEFIKHGFTTEEVVSAEKKYFVDKERFKDKVFN